MSFVVPQALQSDCAACRGVCCVALGFQKGDGFALDKPAGTPCPHLTAEHRCAVHDRLAARGHRGCVSYDCLGAGQRAVACCGDDPVMLAPVFFALAGLHRMLWYLGEGAARTSDPVLGAALTACAARLEGLAALPPARLAALDLDPPHREVDILLRRAIAEARRGLPGAGDARRGGDFFGKDLRDRPLAGRDLSGALLIAARLDGCDLRGVSLLGADVRDASLCGCDLRGCLFLTQGQLETARGDNATRLPAHLRRPAAWG